MMEKGKDGERSDEFQQRGVFTVRMYASRGYFSTGRRARVDRIAWVTAYFMAVVTRDFSLRGGRRGRTRHGGIPVSTASCRFSMAMYV